LGFIGNDVRRMHEGSPGFSSMTRFFGRQREREVLDRLLRSGSSGVLVLRGDAGVGKTALLEYAAQAGSGFRVLKTSGNEAEMELPYAALQQLCSPLLYLSNRLPQPQIEALEVALGLSTGPAPNRFLVGLAVLSLFFEATQEQPLLVVVDDALWLDQASAQALGFVARRLLTERIVLLLATRQIDDVFIGLPELPVAPLGHRDARALLESALPAPLDENILERIVAETRGNPLALLELPKGLTPRNMAGGFGMPAEMTLAASIEASFKRQQAVLPADAQRLLLLAATDPVGDPALVWRAAEKIGISESISDSAEMDDLVTFVPRVVFRHPLVRSAVYGAATPHERREAHRVLAEATDPRRDPDRRAWHRAQSIQKPDEEIAAELEESAGRAQARGGYAAAAAFLEQATALTPQESRRSERALAAAQAQLQAGALDDALRLIAASEAGFLSQANEAKALLVRGQISFLSTRSSDAAVLLLQAADRFREFDPEIARETYLEALTAAIFAGPLAGPGATPREMADASRSAPRTQAPRGPDLLLDGLIGVLCDDYSAAAPSLRHAQHMIENEPQPTEQLRWLWGATVAAQHLWDDEGWKRLAELHLRLVRETGALSELPISLSHVGQMHVFEGELTLATSDQEAIREASELTGSPLAPYHSVSLAAMIGREAEAMLLFESARAELTERGEGAGLSFIDRALAVLHNGQGRYAEALVAAQRVVGHTELVTSNWAMPELIEAAVRVGKSELAAEANTRLTERAVASGTDWG
jgi:tetratricopeptide (TPR) repeat protein